MGAEALALSLGIEPKRAAELNQNAKLAAVLTEVATEAGVASSGCDKAVGILLFQVATKFPPNALVHRPALLAYIVSAQIKTVVQVDAAHAFLLKLGPDALDKSALATASGVGVEVTAEEIASTVAEVLQQNEMELKEKRYRMNVGILLAAIREKQPWADGKAAKVEFDKQLLAMLGPKTEADLAKPAKEKKAKAPAAATKEKDAAAAAAAKEAEAARAAAEEASVNPFAHLPDNTANNTAHTAIYFSDGTIWRPANSRAKLDEHLAATQSKVVTRFPPEPNGYLHIGHAKAMNVDFGYAAEQGGACYLRFDDTNPDAEKTEYIEHIQEIVSWMGWTPGKITYSSDYFQQLYELAVELIKLGRAYVCHQTGDEIKVSREQRSDSPWRDRPVAESLRLFEEMRRGMWPEGSASLRMKQDMRNENYNMFDLIAYRIKFTPHPHAGRAWCIYPSYDYTHCIVDSLENVTHSLCTLEFETRRASYYWLLEALDLYKPVVWEYARLNITGNVLSKRKLNKLVTDRHVHGWDDPRLLTLSGLRRRGAPPSAINNFVREIGITRNENFIAGNVLDHHIREVLNRDAPRCMAVLDPLKVVLTNLPPNEPPIPVAAAVFPQRKGAGEGEQATYPLALSRVLYIERSDFRDEDSKEFYGLAPGKWVQLRYALPMQCVEAVRAPDGRVTELRCEVDLAKTRKPKGVLHWAPAGSAAFEARLYDRLFVSEDPAGKEEWLADINPASLTVVQGALACPPLLAAKPGDAFQLERLGYFAVDPDSTPAHLVLNRTCSLKDSRR